MATNVTHYHNNVLVEVYTLPYLCCNATSPRVKI